MEPWPHNPREAEWGFEPGTVQIQSLNSPGAGPVPHCCWLGFPSWARGLARGLARRGVPSECALGQTPCTLLSVSTALDRRRVGCEQGSGLHLLGNHSQD